MYIFVSLLLFMSVCLSSNAQSVRVIHSDEHSWDELSLVPVLDNSATCEVYCVCKNCKKVTRRQPWNITINLIKTNDTEPTWKSQFTTTNLVLGNHMCIFDNSTSVQFKINYGQCLYKNNPTCKYGICVTTSVSNVGCQHLTNDICASTHDVRSRKSAVCTEDSLYQTLCDALVDFIFTKNGTRPPLSETFGNDSTCHSPYYFSLYIAGHDDNWNCDLEFMTLVPLGSTYHLQTENVSLCYSLPRGANTSLYEGMNLIMSTFCERDPQCWFPVLRNFDESTFIKWTFVSFYQSSEVRTYFYMIYIGLNTNLHINPVGECRAGSTYSALNCSVDYHFLLPVFVSIKFHWSYVGEHRRKIRPSLIKPTYSVINVSEVGNYTCSAIVVDIGYNLYEERVEYMNSFQNTFRIEPDCKDVNARPEKAIGDEYDGDIVTDESSLKKTNETLTIVVAVLAVLLVIIIVVVSVGGFIYHRKRPATAEKNISVSSSQHDSKRARAAVTNVSSSVTLFQ